MRITPLEIRQKNFEKKIRGYDKDEVAAFLTSMSAEWERILDENKEMKIKLEQSEKEVRKLREVENSLFKTLKTAEDTGANLIDQANKAAELHLKESEMNAEAILSESKSKAKAIIEQAELEAKQLIIEMQDAIQDLEKNYKAIANQRNNLLNELQNIVEDVTDRIKRTSRQQKEFDVEDHLIKVRKLVRASEDRINKEALSVETPRQKQIPKVKQGDVNASQKLDKYISEKKPKASKQAPKQNTPKTAPADNASEGSFFDQIG